MNTPAHLIINLLCLGKKDKAKIITPIIIGGILPDAPMFLFYFIERVIRKTPENVIWKTLYYQDHWQNFFDVFNSLPISIVGILISWWTESKIGLLLFASMILHIFGDLPLHHDDGHRHFFPFSNWRFESPVSYWDPNHHGTLMTFLEIGVFIVSSIILFKVYESRSGKIVLGIIGLCYLVYMTPFVFQFHL